MGHRVTFFALLSVVSPVLKELMKTPLERVETNINFSFFKGIRSIQFCIANGRNTLADTVSLVNLGSRWIPTSGTLFTSFHVFPEQGFVFSCLIVRELGKLVLFRFW